MATGIKMDELLVTWLGSDEVYETVMQLMEQLRTDQDREQQLSPISEMVHKEHHDSSTPSSPRGIIPPFYPTLGTSSSIPRKRRTPLTPYDTWEPLPNQESIKNTTEDGEEEIHCVKEQVQMMYLTLGQDPPIMSPSSADSKQGDEEDHDDRTELARKYLTLESFVRITKEICHFPSFFNTTLFQCILRLWNSRFDHDTAAPMDVVTYEMLEWFWLTEMEPYDAFDRFFRLVKQPDKDYIVRDDFLPLIRALLQDHPGLEFLSSHAEFQEKYAVTVITRIFYSVDPTHSGRITSRQLRRSDLLEAFQQVDEEEDINKVTRYFSYEHFYVLYCRFWELDHDRDYRITRDDLLKYGDHSLSHMIVDRIFDAAPKPFDPRNREFLSYEDFIYFMLSEEDKSNEISVRYWFTCVDVDGDGKLNNMEMRAFYAVQLHRMQCMSHDIVPFEDMLCQMMDMIKPTNPDYLVAEDFLKPECKAVAGSLFDALFNLNKYLMFEQRDPFVERQKREDEFECDWDRFACIDYNRLAMEEEAREEEAMEIDWVTVDDEDEEADGSFRASGGKGSNEAPF
jgi:serine/threonine-protein phosphatase 2A regulatory subunit B''